MVQLLATYFLFSKLADAVGVTLLLFLRCLLLPDETEFSLLEDEEVVVDLSQNDVIVELLLLDESSDDFVINVELLLLVELFEDASVQLLLLVDGSWLLPMI
jgi:hypothetical protein